MFLYECWKCPDNHKAKPLEAVWLFRLGIARIGLDFRGKFIPLQTRKSVGTISDLRARIAKR